MTPLRCSAPSLSARRSRPPSDAGEGTNADDRIVLAGRESRFVARRDADGASRERDDAPTLGDRGFAPRDFIDVQTFLWVASGMKRELHEQRDRKDAETT